jgi:hypothetical protein
MRPLFPVPSFPEHDQPYSNNKGLHNISRIAFQVRSPQYALKSAHKFAVVVR